METLALRYPKYGYRCITKLLLRMGYTVGYKRVIFRLMRATNLSVAVKRLCQTTKSIEGVRPYVNHLENVEISRCDQVWVGDITYVRLKARFAYVALLMDVFTRMIRGAGESTPHPTADLETATTGTASRCSRDPSFRSRRSVSLKCLSLDTHASWYYDFGSFPSRVSLGEQVC